MRLRVPPVPPGRSREVGEAPTPPWVCPDRVLPAKASSSPSGRLRPGRGQRPWVPGRAVGGLGRHRGEPAAHLLVSGNGATASAGQPAPPWGICAFAALFLSAPSTMSTVSHLQASRDCPCPRAWCPSQWRELSQPMVSVLLGLSPGSRPSHTLCEVSRWLLFHMINEETLQACRKMRCDAGSPFQHSAGAHRKEIQLYRKTKSPRPRPLLAEETVSLRVVQPF